MQLVGASLDKNTSCFVNYFQPAKKDRHFLKYIIATTRDRTVLDKIWMQTNKNTHFTSTETLFD